MSEVSEFDTSDEWGKLVMKWNAAGHTVVHDRGTFRHKAYMKNLDPEMQIKVDGADYITNHGHALKVGDVLPERADLCLDMDGNLLPQHEFEKRYFEYLNWFDYIEGSDPKAEHIPNVHRYISQVPDQFSESPGMVEAGWDARKPAEKEATHQYDPNTDKMVEIMHASNEKADLTMEAVKRLLEQNAPVADEEPRKRGPGRPRKEI